MRIKINQLLFLVCLFGSIILTGCQKWEDHNDVTDQELKQDLFVQIKGNTNLSKFAELITKSGYDKVLASSRTFTVFAPTNAALASLDAAIIADSAKLSAFVGNHITTQTYFTTGATTQLRLKMLNGKYQNMLNKSIDVATIVEADKYAKNGVVQVIDKMLPVLNNGWEVIQTDASIPALQKNYMLSLFQKMFDPTNAVQIGINQTTGEPIYQPGTDSVTINKFWRSVYDLKDESKQFTLFVLTDAAWTSELNKFKPFCTTLTNNADSTTNFASWAVVKDLAIEGLYNATATTDTVLSKFNVKVPVDKAAIVQTIKTSNGVIYIMNKVDVQPRHKIQPITIEAENYRTTSVDKRGNTYFRDRLNPVTGKIFRDVNVYNHGTVLFNINYRVNEVYSGVKYKAYWVALNDFNGGTAFNQKLAFETPTANTFTLQKADGYTAVNANVYTEVLLGETTLPVYKPVLDVYLTAANSGAAAVNPIVCDYIRLEPQF
ncbi:fasciclin domain-containing protein [Chitinophagaceae bacterium LB-8]|uniref:Fasciclin domain-containing protein n=1 Tax=Paraflavisolibacter caeni TaxID=2982496 RepID=A0A9X2XWF1_9BACT|nr:fasciclin domain-containing protein [Paraflavisolibacter caeni]MCU7550654.1 fasciclin domain-containing protein [Paraflavisolibacter caeni]